MREVLRNLVFGLGLIGASSAGCTTESRACNLMAWNHQLTLDLAPSISAEATYEFEIKDGATNPKCTVTIGSNPVETCSENLSVTRSSTSSVPYGISALNLTYSDAEELPNSLVLSITTDGVKTEYTLTPDYEIDEPNGDGCGERKRATVKVDR